MKGLGPRHRIVLFPKHPIAMLLDGHHCAVCGQAISWQGGRWRHVPGTRLIL